MLAFARLLVGLLTLVAIGLFVHHMWPTGNELLLYHEFVQTSEKCEAPPDEGQFIQTRTNGRRDFVQVEGKKAILTFPTSQIEMDRRGTLKEQLLQPAITALEPTAFANQIGFKTDIQGDSAVIDYRDSLLEVSQLKAKRSYGFLRLSHSTSFLKDSLSTYTHFTGTLTADYAKYHGDEWLLKGNFFATTPTGSLKADLLRGEG
ncbi:MAG: hypothetical protein KDK40_05690, partial [Chlamydiia bacterium]|nr:hypothetical protein [Chlamydiia bacterium]